MCMYTYIYIYMTVNMNYVYKCTIYLCVYTHIHTHTYTYIYIYTYDSPGLVPSPPPSFPSQSRMPLPAEGLVPAARKLGLEPPHPPPPARGVVLGFWVLRLRMS